MPKRQPRKLGIDTQFPPTVAEQMDSLGSRWEWIAAMTPRDSTIPFKDYLKLIAGLFHSMRGDAVPEHWIVLMRNLTAMMEDGVVADRRC